MCVCVFFLFWEGGDPPGEDQCSHSQVISACRVKIWRWRHLLGLFPRQQTKNTIGTEVSLEQQRQCVSVVTCSRRSGVGVKPGQGSRDRGGRLGGRVQGQKTEGDKNNLKSRHHR